VARSQQGCVEVVAAVVEAETSDGVVQGPPPGARGGLERGRTRAAPVCSPCCRDQRAGSGGTGRRSCSRGRRAQVRDTWARAQVLPYKDPFFCFGARAIVHPFWMSVKFHTFYLFINITKNYTLGGGQTNLSLFELLLSVRGVVATEV
jgi:hypothetical protein